MLAFFNILTTLWVASAAPSVQTDCAKVLPLAAGVGEKLKVAMVPFKIEGLKSFEQFTQKIESSTQDAAKSGAKLVVFPELFIADMLEAAEKVESLTVQMQRFAKNHTPNLVEFLKALAIKQKVAIMGGTTARMVGKDIRNSAIFVTADGKVQFQDKLFLTPDEKSWSWSPGEALQVFEAPWGRTVILTCYDAEFPKVSQRLSALAPELIIVPSMTDTVEGFRRVRWTSQARAIEHRAFVIHTGTTGEPDPSWPNYAQASILTPSEKGFPGLAVEGKLNSSDIVYGEIDFAQLRIARKKIGIYPACEEGARRKPINVRNVGKL